MHERDSGLQEVMAAHRVQMEALKREAADVGDTAATWRQQCATLQAQVSGRQCAGSAACWRRQLAQHWLPMFTSCKVPWCQPLHSVHS